METCLGWVLLEVVEFVIPRALFFASGSVFGVEQQPVHRCRLVRRAVDEIVAVEGPITEERLASLVVARFGMMRLKGARLQALLPKFSHLNKTVSEFGTVYWNAERQPGVWTGFRTSDSPDVRSFDDVPAEEISNAMVALVRLGNSAFAEEITRAVLAAFGIQKLGANIKSRLEAILAWTVGQGRLVRDGEEYRIP